ncbi:16S rRNA (guanine(527)-N(7))-methyltransferase RsmG [Campylobacter hepaticus]|uniref:Ribosomal RNA small subunit methyltransferase G n=1 Tax=Campylobacter hepaticus TaxID=1813019 RepID=A0A6I1PIT6_9BACT|nr:16S rRNA (guanine(527)-N(7))-methyltransferase RsmG [Campylobacter hepaticus]AXP08503.1 16S rRNA (guanine(527)-N(7))-methyltransferase RsmG [Campylobacter hepaticus]MPV62443.1 16S rRNA (guanine(527)-N(7))-methyltransferase RsmG [Campylobacter hepaticus]MPV80392.1 16S rRNA (guanine(527)-N(7))-methyltransferase RsmG [Campylobacter hepaticus]MPV82072.1 16S rRNA (guanine(527)-N(7))-methyltransferase RsmG [Campylobacter hepaticus]MPV83129.1 16S rRNA (guanine(527)-N(7))-methyltransferase RsmG [Ca
MNFKNYNFLKPYNLKDLTKKIQIYKDILEKFNRVHNLTHLKNIDENIFDSIKILDFYDFSQAKNIADIGSGAGFPAIFLAFLLKNNFHLFEPNAKKAAFLRKIKIECDLKHLNIYKEKIENFQAIFKADIITSRALMDTPSLLKICKNISNKNSIFILWKGSGIYEELKHIKNYKIFENNFRKYCILSSP